jgi:hypothetical protein
VFSLVKQPAIIAAVRSGSYDPITWAEVHSGPVAFAVSTDALRIDGVRVNVSARTAQECVDALGCVLPTPCIEDLVYAAADVKLRAFPIPTGPDGSAAQTAAHSKRIDDALREARALPSQLVATVGKSWVLCNSLVSRPGFAANYGWHDNRAQHESVTEDWRVYQPLGTRHNLDHFDYSQTLRLVHRNCRVDGRDCDLRDVMTDPKMAIYVSHEGPLRITRQPGMVANES